MEIGSSAQQDNKQLGLVLLSFDFINICLQSAQVETKKTPNQTTKPTKKPTKPNINKQQFEKPALFSLVTTSYTLTRVQFFSQAYFFAQTCNTIINMCLRCVQTHTHIYKGRQDMLELDQLLVFTDLVHMCGKGNKSDSLASSKIHQMDAYIFDRL